MSKVRVIICGGTPEERAEVCASFTDTLVWLSEYAYTKEDLEKFIEAHEDSSDYQRAQSVIYDLHIFHNPRLDPRVAAKIAELEALGYEVKLK